MVLDELARVLEKTVLAKRILGEAGRFPVLDHQILEADVVRGLQERRELLAVRGLARGLLGGLWLGPSAHWRRCGVLAGGTCLKSRASGA